MPIVISRTGEMAPVTTGAAAERRNEAWAQIVQTWAEKNPELLKPESEAEQRDAQ